MKGIGLLILLIATGFIGLATYDPTGNPVLRKSPVVLPAAPTTTHVQPEFVIFYSGDGGWEQLEQRVSANLNEHGYAVLGISTLAYFWREQPVADSAAQLDSLIDTYRKRWNAPRVWLIGFSFGASVLPSIANQLKPENRARISQLTLLEPTEDVFLEIELENHMPLGWRDRISQTYRHLRQPVTHHDPFPALHQLEGKMPVNCLQTTKPMVGLCSLPAFPDWIITSESHGNHYFNGDFNTLTQRLIEQHPTAAAGP